MRGEPAGDGRLRKTALERLEAEEDELLDAGQDPDVLHERICSLILPLEHPIDRDLTVSGQPSSEVQRDRLNSLLRPSAQRASLQDRKLEGSWLPNGAEV